MTRELEYLEEALQEAEAAARWYAERSVTAAARFSDEIDVAESAIVRLPEAWPPFESRHAPVPASTFSVQHRLSNRGSPHLDRCRGARSSPTGILEGEIVVGRELYDVKNSADKWLTIGSGWGSVEVVSGVQKPQ